ncbi:MAG: hypothetical protein ACREPF_05075 [Rhodanobacteraceae bacterium]
MFSVNHREHLLVAFRHLDAVLAEVEALLRPPAVGTVFNARVGDIDASTCRRAESAIAAVREELRAFMVGHALHAPPPALSARHAANAQLALAMVEAAELDPRHLRGYGELTDSEIEELAALSERLHSRLAAVIRTLPEPSR